MLTDDYIALGIEEKMQHGKTRFLLLPGLYGSQ
jgi:hypothetical protein